jgi:hypothetical protein
LLLAWPGKRCVARSPMNDIPFLEKKASEVSAVLTGYAGDEGHFVIYLGAPFAC